ncbi:hypothetical protein M405DRAFT_247865 [Rhizopogon salebrosus TDB-379]|nr:hypothetical protein M405DRAFT_247865 [Rhizopogon salebrosus TDB-379]
MLFDFYHVCRMPDVIHYVTTSTGREDPKEGPMDEPLIEIVLPPRPRKRTQVEEAHLYFAPPAVGKGNHLFVYFAEWELPRDLFVQAQLCSLCRGRCP